MLTSPCSPVVSTAQLTSPGSLFEQHSKEKCDMVFGVLTNVWKYENLLTAECLGRSAETRPSKEAADRKYRVYFVNGDACSS